MAFNLRMPAGTELLVRARAQELGISLNAFVLIALSTYLKSGADASMDDLLPTPMREKAVKTPRVNKGPAAAPKLSSPPTKAELVALHNWEYEQKQLQMKLEAGPDFNPSEWRGKSFNAMREKRLKLGVDSWMPL